MFGLSFGMNKTKSSSTTDVNKTETQNSTETGTKSTTGTTTNTGTSATQTQQAGTQSGTSAQQTTGTQASTGKTTQFSDSVLGGLESAVGDLLKNIPTTGTSMGGDFNHDRFVQAGMDAATNRVQSDLDTSLNSMFDNIGGRDDSNSMVTLLANRARGDASANLSGQYATLEAQAQGIDRDRFLANLQGRANTQGYLSSVLGALKGGEATTTGNVATSEAQTGATTQANQQTGSSATQSSEQQTQALVEALQNILAGTTTTVGTEKTKSKGSSIGGGAGLSI